MNNSLEKKAKPSKLNIIKEDYQEQERVFEREVGFRNDDKGFIAVITGPMYAGKTSALIQRYRSISVCRPVAVYKPSRDTRYSKTYIVSHDGDKITATTISDLNDTELKKEKFI
jgi:predicted AAA+ superfamily ATPase